MSLNFLNLTKGSMELYFDLIDKIPDFKEYDIMGEEHYAELGISPLGSIANWLNDLIGDNQRNELLIKKICHYLNDTYKNADSFKGDIINEFSVYFFWNLEYPTIEQIKVNLSQEVLDNGRTYLKAIEGENYREF